MLHFVIFFFFFFQAEDGIRDADVTGVQTCALPIYRQLNCGSFHAVLGEDRAQTQVAQSLQWHQELLRQTANIQNQYEYHHTHIVQRKIDGEPVVHPIPDLAQDGLLGLDSNQTLLHNVVSMLGSIVLATSAHVAIVASYWVLPQRRLAGQALTS